MTATTTLMACWAVSCSECTGPTTTAMAMDIDMGIVTTAIGNIGAATVMATGTATGTNMAMTEIDADIAVIAGIERGVKSC